MDKYSCEVLPSSNQVIAHFNSIFATNDDKHTGKCVHIDTCVHDPLL